MNEHDFDDCECPAGVMTRTEGSVRYGFIVLILCLAVGLLNLVRIAIENISLVVRSVNWPSFAATALIVLVSIIGAIYVLLSVYAIYYDWKHESKTPKVLNWFQRIGRELFASGVNIASKIEYRRLMKKRPEIVGREWSELVLDQLDHDPAEQVTDPKILEAIMAAFTEEQRRIKRLNERV